MKAAKLTDRAKHLLKEIHAGRNRVFAMDDRPPGWLQLERAGLVERFGTEQGKLTAAGEMLISELLKGMNDGKNSG
jgi:hypothetical protein